MEPIYSPGIGGGIGARAPPLSDRVAILCRGVGIGRATGGYTTGGCK